jgi:ornithine carbamoyltransferase
MTKSFLDISDLDAAALRSILDDSVKMKAVRGTGAAAKLLSGKTLAMIFERPSTRTRISFDVAMRDLGGETMILSSGDMQLGRGETVADTARVMSRYVDAIMIRTLDDAMVAELADVASIPVINGLTSKSHPCQIMADLMTFEEHRGPITGRKVAWVGDANNVLTSWIHAAARLGFEMSVAAPDEYGVAPDLLDWARANGAEVNVTTDAATAVAGADCVVTDTWVSMGDDEGAARRLKALQAYQVTAELMERADPGAVFMHCLPAHRGEEVTAEVIDGPRSVVFDEAENRLHAQKGVLLWCFDLSQR